MDESVKKALAKWPDAPSCTGWLLLDRRGVWRMRDEAAQAAGAPGDPIRHAALLGFINRNYAVDEASRWFFQNGPQRVYVELECAPWVARLNQTRDGLVCTDQTGGAFLPASCLIDEAGTVFLVEQGPPERLAVLHDHDLDLFVDHARLDTDVSAPGAPRGDGGGDNSGGGNGNGGSDRGGGSGTGSASGTFRCWYVNGRQVPVTTTRRGDLPRRFCFVPSPQRHMRALSFHQTPCKKHGEHRNTP